MAKYKVMIDCEKTKAPNTGLHSFCTQLANCIKDIESEYDIDSTILLTKRGVASLPNHKHRILNIFDRVFFALNGEFKVFHAPFQLGKYFPHKTPTVLTIHDLNFLYEKSGRKRKRLKHRAQRNIKRADYLVAISQFAKNDVLKHLNTQNKPFDVIYNGCTFYTGNKIENPTYHPQSEFIFSLGTVLRKKNFHVLPPLLVGNNLQLIIAGNLSPYANKIMEEAKLYGVEDRVKIIGAISEADKDWYYRNCKAFVFPSIAEGFGLPVIEALHYGKPTFISRHTSLPEIGKDYCYYFNYNFTPSDMQQEFKAGMEHFATRNPQELTDYAHTYSWKNAAREYCKIYRKLIDNKI